MTDIGADALSSAEAHQNRLTVVGCALEVRYG
jgi:hypothetical protein